MIKKVISLLVPFVLFLLSFGYLAIGVVNYNGLSWKTFMYYGYYLHSFMRSEQFTVSYVYSFIINNVSFIWYLIAARVIKLQERKQVRNG